MKKDGIFIKYGSFWPSFELLGLAATNGAWRKFIKIVQLELET